MILNILTPEKNVFSGEIEYVQLPGIDGSFGVLKNHAPMIAALQEGTLKYKVGADTISMEIKSGIVEVLQDKVSVLTEGVQ